MLCSTSDRGLIVLAPAKLNLFLRIVARRSDGFHEIESVMAAVNLYDTLTFQPIASDTIELNVVDAFPRSSHGAIRSEAPAGPTNLVVRAAMLLKEHAGCRHGTRISLIKRIPSSAGLGGGSSDCAATLEGLNRLWGLGLPKHELLQLAGRLGSDIPFFLGKSTVALCTGRGEILEPVRVSTALHLVIAKPASGLSTPAVYRGCHPDTSGQSAERFLTALQTGMIGRVAQRLHNGLQAPAETLSSDVRRLRSLFEQESVVGHQMSGSGSSYFGVCRSRRHAIGVASRLKSAGVPWVQVVRSCP
ncbi:MAG: 4-(cytidine 5'-diphospho)-2-C-methyl-D-erythritol kinase [Planctomycetes bacterium]|nr:4-(cytidine 5'-diphospho)-2-C-methyl-D-erythritol kinase [Planctomycetota bacterium]